jgi:hypothetical protein
MAAAPKSSSMVSTLPEVEVPGMAQRSGRPTAEEDRGGERRRSSTISTPTGGGCARGCAKGLGQPTAEEDCKGER